MAILLAWILELFGFHLIHLPESLKGSRRSVVLDSEHLTKADRREKNGYGTETVAYLPAGSSKRHPVIRANPTSQLLCRYSEFNLLLTKSHAEERLAERVLIILIPTKCDRWEPVVDLRLISLAR